MLRKIARASIIIRNPHSDADLGIDANNGIGDAYDKIQSLPEDQQAEIKADLVKWFV